MLRLQKGRNIEDPLARSYFNCRLINMLTQNNSEALFYLSLAQRSRVSRAPLQPARFSVLPCGFSWWGKPWPPLQWCSDSAPGTPLCWWGLGAGRCGTWYFVVKMTHDARSRNGYTYSRGRSDPAEGPRGLPSGELLVVQLAGGSSWTLGSWTQPSCKRFWGVGSWH